MDFSGKSVLVTGAGRGIGSAIAQAFAGEGANVAVNYLTDAESATETVVACEQKGGAAIAIRSDVTQKEGAKNLVTEAIEAFGKIDVLVNNAFHPYQFDPERRSAHWDLDWQDYQHQFEGAVRAAHNMAQAVVPNMLIRAEGSIVNIATNLIARPVVPYHDYATAKAALVGFTRTLAAELGPLGIRVNAVAPGLVYPTKASQNVREKIKEEIISATPLQRIAKPQDVAGPALFLASPWSAFMTGQTIYVDGGLVMG
jgi:3-oxoacyl-[acyl-carrier protein] reductase